MNNNHRATNVRYEEHGSGENVILLIHGFMSSSHYWNKVASGLVDAGYRTVAINLLGFGKAEKPGNIEYGYGDQIEYIERIIEDLKLTQPFCLVGHSMGALITARYAKLHPTNVKSLVLIHPPLYKDTHEAQMTLENTSMIYRYLLGSKYRNVGWKLLRLLLPHIIASHTQHSREQSLRNVVLKAELMSDLEDVAVKTLLLIGLKDRTIYQNNLPAILSNPLVEVVKENVNHHSPVQSPLLVQKYIIQFDNKKL